jgi:hypothetical protein
MLRRQPLRLEQLQGMDAALREGLWTAAASWCAPWRPVHPTLLGPAERRAQTPSPGCLLALAGKPSKDTGGSAEQAYVRAVIELHDKYQDYVSSCFANSSLFHKALKEVRGCCGAVCSLCLGFGVVRLCAEEDPPELRNRFGVHKQARWSAR